MHSNKVHVQNETNQLKTVVLGLAKDIGHPPNPQQCYDPKSLENVLNNSYPEEAALVHQMEGFKTVLEKYKVEVLRPKNIVGLHQVFARDIAFVIEDYFFKPNIIEDRAKEWEAIEYIVAQMDPKTLISMPPNVRIEGGDVLVYNNKIFVGYSKEEDFGSFKVARTNVAGLHFLKEFFPKKEVIGFELNKSDTDPRAGALHLDCCFQPVGRNKALLCEAGFKHKEDFTYLVQEFGEENCLFLEGDELYDLCSNIFSISPSVVVSQKEFVRVNTWLRDVGITVEAIEYDQISKMGGLFRCSTMPLIRE